MSAYPRAARVSGVMVVALLVLAASFTGVEGGMMLPPMEILTYAGDYSLGNYTTYTDDVPATTSSFFAPMGCGFDQLGNLIVVLDHHCVRRVDQETQLVNTIAGTCAVPGYEGDGGPASDALFSSPSGMAVAPSGDTYICDSGNNAVRRINASMHIDTIAGNGTAGYSGDGGASRAAQLNYPLGIAVDAAGNIYISDTVRSSPLPETAFHSLARSFIH